MAQGERAKVRLDEFIAKVVPDPKSPGEALLLTGFLGAAADSKQTRIYWDASLGSYVDVDAADIIHSEPLPKEQSPLGGSYIWVKRSAEVTVAAGGQTTKGKFFEGPLMTAYGGMFGSPAAAGAAGVAPGAAAVHVTLSVACRTLPVVCRPSVAPCVTPDCTLQCTPGCHFPTVVGPGCVVTLDLAGCPAAAGAAAAGAGGIPVTNLCTRFVVCTPICPPSVGHPCITPGCTPELGCQ